MLKLILRINFRKKKKSFVQCTSGLVVISCGNLTPNGAKPSSLQFDVVSPSIAEPELPEPYHFDPARTGTVSVHSVPIPIIKAGGRRRKTGSTAGIFMIKITLRD
jgi:hypothetical protein